MALFDLFKHKRKEPKRPMPKAPVEAAPTTAPEPAGPAIAAPSSPVLKSFHVSEKATRGLADNQYTFMVGPRATKSQVRDAVTRSCKVDVVAVNIVRLPSKKRTFGRHTGSVPARKKAIVTLKDGQSIAAAQP
jgi:large subunit ribosomal protein L23